MRILETIYGGIAGTLYYLACIWFAGMLILVTVSAAARYFFEAPFGFTEELVGLLVTTMLLMAIPFISHEDKHIKVTMVSDHFRGWLKTAARIFSGLVTLTFTFWFAYASLDWLGFAIELNLKTTNTGIPLVPWMVVMPLVMFLLAVAGLIALVKTVVNPHESVDQGLKGGD